MIDVLQPSASKPDAVTSTATCLNCTAPLSGAYCAACGQRSIELTASTWHVLKEGLEDATDVDGRVLRTARALVSPGQLTTEFLRGRRAPYLGPVKLFLFAGTVLTTTWILTRGVDSHYYGLRADSSAGGYIATVVRGSLTAGIAIAGIGWLIGLGRRRLLDEVVFALHLVAALALWSAAVIWLGTAWKVVWGTSAAAPARLPGLQYLLFLPAVVIGVSYVVVAVQRVYRAPSWATVLRAATIMVGGAVALIGVIELFA